MRCCASARGCRLARGSDNERSLPPPDPPDRASGSGPPRAHVKRDGPDRREEAHPRRAAADKDSRFVSAGIELICQCWRGRECIHAPRSCRTFGPGVASRLVGAFFRLRPVMKVKTFLGTDAAEVDEKVNDWLAESKVHVRRTSTAFKHLRDRGKDALTGRTVARHGVGIAISIWYDPAGSQIRTGWSGKLRQKARKSKNY